MNSSPFDAEGISESVARMTESHLKNTMQLAVFYTASGEIYAVNVAKIQNFAIMSEIEIVPNRDEGSVIIGAAMIRGELVTFVNLERWLGMPERELDEFCVGVICNVNNRRIGFFVREIVGIEDRLSSELKIPDSRAMKILYVTTVKIGGEERPCAVFDIERLMAESGFQMETPPFVAPEKEEFIDKKVLIAEDSATIAKKMGDFFDSIGVAHEIYNDGDALITRLEAIDANEIGAVITDLEMPIRDGFQVVQFVKNSEKLRDIPIAVNSSMTSGGVIEKARRLGASEFVNKSDKYGLYEFIKKHFGKEQND